MIVINILANFNLTYDMDAKSLFGYNENKWLYRSLAATLPENIPSINLLKKLKFSFVGMNEHGEEIYTLDFNCPK